MTTNNDPCNDVVSGDPSPPSTKATITLNGMGVPIVSADDVKRWDEVTAIEYCVRLSRVKGVIPASFFVDVALVLTSHLNHVAVVEHACRTLFTLALNDSNGRSIVLVDGLTALTSAMKHHAGVVSLQEAVCRVLWNLCATPDGAAALAGRWECVQLTLSAMSRHHDSARLQEQAMRVLNALCSSACTLRTSTAMFTPGGSDGGGGRSGGEGGSSSASVDGSTAHVAVRVMEWGYLGHVTRAMDAFVDVSGVQEQGCRALRLLLAQPGLVAAVVAAKGHNYAGRARDTHRDHEGVQKHAAAVVTAVERAHRPKHRTTSAGSKVRSEAEL